MYFDISLKADRQNIQYLPKIATFRIEDVLFREILLFVFLQETIRAVFR